MISSGSGYSKFLKLLPAPASIVWTPAPLENYQLRDFELRLRVSDCRVSKTCVSIHDNRCGINISTILLNTAVLIIFLTSFIAPDVIRIRKMSKPSVTYRSQLPSFLYWISKITSYISPANQLLNLDLRLYLMELSLFLCMHPFYARRGAGCRN